MYMMYLCNHVQFTAVIIIVLCECNAINQVSVEWSHPWILSTGSKDKTSLQDFIIPLLYSLLNTIQY